MLRYWWFIAATVLAVLFFGSIFPSERSVRADELYDAEELKFLKLINDYRKDKGLTPLILSDALTVASERHSEDMGRHNFFAHDSVTSSYFPTGSKPWDRMKLSGYDQPNSSKAENLAAGYESAQKNFEAWRASPGHNKNMLDADQRVIGIARVHTPASKHRWYWTTDFGSEVDITSHAPGETPPSRKDEQRAHEQTSPSEKADEAKDLVEQDQDDAENGRMNVYDGVWKQKSVKKGKRLIRNRVTHLGGYDDAKDEISQKIRIKEGHNELFYRVRILTKETEQLHPPDVLFVRLTDEDGEQLATLRRHTNADARKAGGGGWIWGSVDLSRYEGETVNLSFLAKTDGKLSTTFYLDDVALK